MPCYLFTYHAYRSWLPDRSQGFVKRGEGIQEPDPALAKAYRERAKQEQTWFDDESQKVMIDALVEACEKQQCRLHYVATDATHLHLLVSWRIDRDWKTMRTCLKGSVSRRLNERLRRQLWFGRSASRKRVEDRKHFDYLMDVYLPKHQGLKWHEGKGLLPQ
jgi:REP element-mobilizing transposase RayT